MRPIDADELIVIEFSGIKFVPKEFIDDAPIIEPEHRWIPCSERLPKVGERVMRTIKEYGWNGEEYYAVDIGIYDTNIEHIVAWMPLPEPYQEEGEQDEAD